VFAIYDDDKSGSLDEEEFTHALSILGERYHSYVYMYGWDADWAWLIVRWLQGCHHQLPGTHEIDVLFPFPRF
jgi:hypothetical protein